MAEKSTVVAVYYKNEHELEAAKFKNATKYFYNPPKRLLFYEDIKGSMFMKHNKARLADNVIYSLEVIDAMKKEWLAERKKALILEDRLRQHNIDITISEEEFNEIRVELFSDFKKSLKELMNDEDGSIESTIKKKLNYIIDGELIKYIEKDIGMAGLIKGLQTIENQLVQIDKDKTMSLKDRINLAHRLTTRQKELIQQIKTYKQQKLTSEANEKSKQIVNIGHQPKHSHVMDFASLLNNGGDAD